MFKVGNRVIIIRTYPLDYPNRPPKKATGTITDVKGPANDPDSLLRVKWDSWSGFDGWLAKERFKLLQRKTNKEMYEDFIKGEIE